MEEKEIVELVEKEVNKAKLEVAEKRLHFVLWLAGAFLALFGVIIPLILTMQSTGKIDQAIEDMESKFDELAGIQLRKPDIECLYNSLTLEGSTLSFSQSKHSQIILLKNSGDSPAKNILMRLYVKPDFLEIQYLYPIDYSASWERLLLIDEPNYDCCYELKTLLGPIDAGDFRLLEIPLPVRQIPADNYSLF